MALLQWLGLSLLVAVQSTAVKNCHPGCQCEVESFGLFDSFSLTRVDCRGLGPSTSMPIPIPLDTTHLDLSSSAMGPVSDTMLAGPGYTTLVSLDLSSNHITKVSGPPQWWVYIFSVVRWWAICSSLYSVSSNRYGSLKQMDEWMIALVSNIQ